MKRHVMLHCGKVKEIDQECVSALAGKTLVLYGAPSQRQSRAR